MRNKFKSIVSGGDQDMTEDFLVIPAGNVSADGVLNFAIAYTWICSNKSLIYAINCDVLGVLVRIFFGGGCCYLILYILSGELFKTLAR